MSENRSVYDDGTQGHIRWMIRRDMPEVLQMDEAGFGYDGWSEEMFLSCLRERNAIGMVVEEREQPNRVLGFMLYTLHKHRLELVRICVHPDFRRVGIGEHMLDKLKSKLDGHRRSSIELSVPDDNKETHLFLKENDFRAVRVDVEGWPDTITTYRFIYGVPQDAAEDVPCGTNEDDLCEGV